MGVSDWRWAKDIKECLGKEVATHNRTYTCVGYMADMLKCLDNDGIEWAINWLTVRIRDVQSE